MVHKKVLVIEDDSDLSKFLRIRLEQNGFITVLAADGYEGLYKYLNEKPDLIILDIMLPDMDGYEICRKIRRELDDEKTPIIMLTAMVQDFDRIKGRVIGADKYMTKPFDGEMLMKEIKKYLGV